MRGAVLFMMCVALVFSPDASEAHRAPPRCQPLGEASRNGELSEPPRALTMAENAAEALGVHPTLLLYSLGTPEPPITTKLAIEFANCGIIAIPVTSSPTVTAGEQPVADAAPEPAATEAALKAKTAAEAASKAAAAASRAANAAVAADAARKKSIAAAASKAPSADAAESKAMAASTVASKAAADAAAASKAAAKAAAESTAAASSATTPGSKASPAAPAPGSAVANASDKPEPSVILSLTNVQTGETALYPPNLSQALARSHNLCANNTLIFTYLVEEAQLDRTLIGETRTRIKAVGYLYNCDRRIIGVYEGEDNKRELTNPGLALFKYIGIAVALKPHIQSVALTTSTPLISSFFDRSSNQQLLLADGAQRAFLHMIRDDLCAHNPGVCQDVTGP